MNNLINVDLVELNIVDSDTSGMEKECLDKLVEFYKSSDASSTPSSTLRKLLINWSNLEKYVVSIDEIRSKVSDICKNNKDNLPNDILNILDALKSIADNPQHQNKKVEALKHDI